MMSKKPHATFGNVIGTAFLAVVLAGCSGADGAAGRAGKDGKQGPPGDAGAQGPTGKTGTTGAVGEKGPAGDPGVSEASLLGTVTNSLSNAPLEGVTVSFVPNAAADLTTDASGNYTTKLPIGTYTVSFKKDKYKDASQSASIVAGVDQTLDVKLEPNAPVLVDAGPDIKAAPGANASLSATLEVFDGSTGATYSWKQISGPTLAITGGDTASPSVTLVNADAYKQALFTALAPPDRLMVLGVDPYALEEAGTAEFEVTVTTSSGSYTDTVNVIAKLGLAPNIGIQNVAVGDGLLLLAQESANGYAWTLTPPSGSTATLDSASSRLPILVPDVKGQYTVTETKSGKSLVLYAGKWVGAISGVNASDGRPDTKNCTLCHNGNLAFKDKFVQWRASGHAEIFTQNVTDPANHWAASSCGSCHGVGYNPDVANNGWDEQIAAENWTKPAGTASAYSDMFTSSPKTAQFANIQCENCHGPNDSDAHTSGAVSRVSVDSRVCGSCHGEPLRHGRYQQWKESKHGDYSLAVLDGTVENRGATAGHCGRCHTAQGFMAWVKQGDYTKQIQGASGNATVAELTAMGLSTATVHPQTCVTCHDPHAQGTLSGKPNNATLRIDGDTGALPAGFKAIGVGHGAICITCHNTRNGAHNDNVALTSYTAPHTAAQGDVLMGQSVYFVQPGQRGGHSYIDNTCTTCHMELTAPPANYSYQSGGTNHLFTAESTICGNCHGQFQGGSLESVVTQSLADMEKDISAAAITKLTGLGVVHARAYDVATDLYSSSSSSNANVTLDFTTNPIVSIGIADGHGQIEFEFTLTNAINITWTDGSTTSTKEFGVQLGSLFTDVSGVKGPAVWGTGNMVKACWNYLLLEGDGSKGVHNPDLYMNVINATMVADLSN